mmetsp:Transcript_12080/g.25502  ORF Transcript_12080/g.25502 Transcript_12080/m.25502 type:complete len:209 (+) Transcript_12080:104-730(+)
MELINSSRRLSAVRSRGGCFSSPASNMLGVNREAVDFGSPSNTIASSSEHRGKASGYSKGGRLNFPCCACVAKSSPSDLQNVLHSSIGLGLLCTFACSEPPASAGACTKRGSSSFVGGRTCSFRAGLRYSLLSRAVDTLRSAASTPARLIGNFFITASHRSSTLLSSSSSLILSALPMFSPPRSSCTHTVITICDCGATAVLGAVEMC